MVDAAARHLGVDRPARPIDGEGDRPGAGGEDLPAPLTSQVQVADVLAVLGSEPVRVAKIGRRRRLGWGVSAPAQGKIAAA